FLHLSEFKTKVGAEVKQGEVLATTGNTGRSTGPPVSCSPAPRSARASPPRWRLAL
ncbi:MAG: M23 family metallopeptidase, partial [Minicystis sp.]